MTDGLADSVWPVWDASGKYLWFFASTDLGLKSQWLDMTSYDHDEDFGLYLSVLNKADASPLLPESDEDNGVGSAPAEAVEGDADVERRPPRQPKAGRINRRRVTPRGPVNVQIDFDGIAAVVSWRFRASRSVNIPSFARARPAPFIFSKRGGRTRRARRRTRQGAVATP